MDNNLVVENLSIIDKAGRVRATLGVEETGEVGLYIWDCDGKARAFFGVLASGELRLHMRGSDGRPRARVDVENDGSTEFVLLDGAGNWRGGIRSDKDGHCFLLLKDDDTSAHLDANSVTVRDSTQTSGILPSGLVSDHDELAGLQQLLVVMALRSIALHDLLVANCVIDEKEYAARIARLQQGVDQARAASRDAACMSIMKEQLERMEDARSTKDESKIRDASFGLEMAVKRWLASNAPLDDVTDIDESKDRDDQ